MKMNKSVKNWYYDEENQGLVLTEAIDGITAVEILLETTYPGINLESKRIESSLQAQKRHNDQN